MNFITKWKAHHKNAMFWIKKDKNYIYIIAGSIAIIIIASIVSHYIPQSRQAQENIKQYKILEKMIAIDDIAHEQDKILHDIGSGYNIQRDRLFHIADNAYHKAQSRDEKYRAAKELNKLIQKQNTFIFQLIDQNNPYSQIAKEKFEKLQKEIDFLEK